jgi:hypothetical protein
VIAAMRGRLPRGAVRDQLEVGFEGSARIAPDHERWEVEATVSSLDRTATLLAAVSCACDKTRFHLAAIARATPDEAAWGATFFARRHPPEDSASPTLTYGVEVLDLDDADRRSAHLVLQGGW